MSVQKHYEERQSTIRTDVVDSVTCDLCGRVDVAARPEGDGIDWNKRSEWVVRKHVVTVALEVTTLDERGNLDTIEKRSLDVCLDCIHTRIFALAPDKVKHDKMEF